MSTIHYVDQEYTYMGGFNTEQPDLIEVPAPAHGKDVWTGKEWIPYDTSTEVAQQELADSDGDVAMIGEELIDILLAKGVIDPHDLSDAALAKLVARKTARSRLK